MFFIIFSSAFSLYITLTKDSSIILVTKIQSKPTRNIPFFRSIPLVGSTECLPRIVFNGFFNTVASFTSTVLATSLACLASETRFPSSPTSSAMIVSLKEFPTKPPFEFDSGSSISFLIRMRIFEAVSASGLTLFIALGFLVSTGFSKGDTSYVAFPFALLVSLICFCSIHVTDTFESVLSSTSRLVSRSRLSSHRSFTVLLQRIFPSIFKKVSWCLT